MTYRSRQTTAGLVVTVLVVVLLVAMSVGAVVLVGTAPVAAQANETGDAGDGATTGAPPEGGASDTDTDTDTGDDDADSTANESDDDGGEDSSDRADSALPDSGSDSAADTTADAGDTANETVDETTGTVNETVGETTGGSEDEGSSDDQGAYTAGDDDEDDSMFSVSIDPVGLLIRLFEPFFTLGTSLLTGMAEALQSSTIYPMQDGSVAISGEPDGALMSVLYEYWYSVGLAVSAAIWLINTLVLYILTMVWPATPTYQEMVIARKEAWLKLFLIPFSWALGTIILFTASFALNAVPLNPEVIAPDTSSIAANNAAAGVSVLLLYAFGGAFALALAFTFLGTWVALYIIFPLMPILIAMSVPKVWIMKPVAEAFESVLQLFPSAAFFPLPAVMVLSAGYWALGTFESFLPGPAKWGVVPANMVAIIVIWLLAFLSSLYLFWFKRVGAGAGAILAGSVGLGAVSSALGKLGGGAAAGSGAAAGAAGGAAGSSASTLPGGVERAVNGHALGSGDSGGSTGALASSGGDTLATAGTSTGTNPSGTAIPSGSGSSSSSGSPTASASSSPSTSGSAGSEADMEGSMPGRIPVDDPSPTTIETEDDLPDQEYRVGYFTGSGPGSDMEFQKMLNVPRSTERITGETYARVAEAREEKDLFVRGQDDQQFYDVDPLVDSGRSGIGLSEAEQIAESRSTVNDARGDQ